MAILNSLNVPNLPNFQPILILVSKFMVHIALSDKTYLSLGLLSPLNVFYWYQIFTLYSAVVEVQMHLRIQCKESEFFTIHDTSWDFLSR